MEPETEIFTNGAVTKAGIRLLDIGSFILVATKTPASEAVLAEAGKDPDPRGLHLRVRAMLVAAENAVPEAIVKFKPLHRAAKVGYLLDDFAYYQEKGTLPCPIG
ncbi:hypothetical protein BLJ79_19830 [Arthrobacter sp. UCD-GKA]|uniref:hypothetical protein n=1 Tax=Arthrobacter sp. UCD-GKA TaxID=1913576 RepID=UPI0008DDAF51|nr:hypothetical protein [Arthrobacter sp. UCD-GKA]OIH82186.1 hypothetical protein BLJ79_19830 [Arthrobacter sp. UCD-GKA]